jgi:hypothetical protein
LTFSASAGRDQASAPSIRATKTTFQFMAGPFYKPRAEPSTQSLPATGGEPAAAAQ